uniref:Cadherin domain-containing protein n=1 Tax=Panagrellus redivivus TaxID=6233 RepID=A0A7E4V6Q5_PANRE
MSVYCEPVLVNGTDAYIVSSDDVTPIVCDSVTPEVGIAAISCFAPPTVAKCAYVLTTDFQLRQRCVEAFRKAGYADVESIDFLSVSLSSDIFNLPLKCATGEPVFVFVGLNDPFWKKCPVNVIQKCENGWRIIKRLQFLPEAFFYHPTVRNFVIHGKTPETTKLALKNLYPGVKLHLSQKPDDLFKFDFIRNRIIKGDLNGYEVHPYFDYDFRIGKKGSKLSLPIYDRVPPFIAKQAVSIGDASEVEIYAVTPAGRFSFNNSQSDKEPPTLVKTFKFDSYALRTVMITITVDKTLIPQATLEIDVALVPLKKETSAKDASELPKKRVYSEVFLNLAPFNAQQNKPPSVVFSIINRHNYALDAHYPNHTSSEGEFKTLREVIAQMLKTAPISSTAAIYCVNTITARSDLQKFSDTCKKLGYPTVKFISNVSYTLSLILGMSEIIVNSGQQIVILDSLQYHIVVSDGTYLSVVKFGTVDKIDSKYFKGNPTVVENGFNIYSEVNIDNLRQLCYPAPVYVVTGVKYTLKLQSKYFLSLANGTGFDGKLFYDYSDVDFGIKGVGVAKTVDTRFKATPFTVTTDVEASNTKLSILLVTSAPDVEMLKEFVVPRGVKDVRFTFHVESICDITVSMDVIDKDRDGDFSKTNTLKRLNRSQNHLPLTSCENAEVKQVDASRSIEKKTGDVPKKRKNGTQRRKEAILKAEKEKTVSDPTKSSHCPQSRNGIEVATSNSTLPKELSQLKLESPPKTVLTFTSDNRVLIEADETYTGDKEVLAYVRLQGGKPPQVGKEAFDALKKYPDSVYYDITRLMATDFDPNYPHPMWSFKTTRDADGKVVIRGSDNVETLPIVLFGLVVNSTLLYIKEHLKSDVTHVGIRLPTGSVVSANDLKQVSERIGVELVMLKV